MKKGKIINKVKKIKNYENENWILAINLKLYENITKFF